MSNASRDLELLRFELLSIDRALIALLSERMQLSKKIGKCKKSLDLPIDQPDVWEEMSKHRFEYGNEQNLTDEFVDSLFKVIHDQSKLEQNK
jgi:chorismate mutase